MLIGENRKISQSPFEVVDNYISHLGLKIFKKKNDLLLELNFTEGLDKLKRSIDIWKTLPLSMLGRVNAIKMITLPKFIYLLFKTYT